MVELTEHQRRIDIRVHRPGCLGGVAEVAARLAFFVGRLTRNVAQTTGVEPSEEEEKRILRGLKKGFKKGLERD